jgi:hypothetical protein
MTASAEHKASGDQKGASGARIVWFEIPADNVERARRFYRALFGWKIELFQGMQDYWQIDTGAGQEGLNGGMMARQHPHQPVVHYVDVPSVNQSLETVQQLGGKVLMPPTAVPGMGYFAVCQDTENNTFGLWESDESAK